jgi:hypothetical protein
MTSTANAQKALLLSALLLILAACAAGTPYKVYFGDPRQDMQLATVQGGSFIRVEMLNLYLDTGVLFRLMAYPLPIAINTVQPKSRPGFTISRSTSHGTWVAYVD